MRETRGEVAGGVHSITRGGTEGHTDRNYNHGHRPGSDSAGGRDLICPHAEDQEHQHEGGHYLAEEIAPFVADCRRCAEAAEHCGGIVRRGVEMVFVEEPDQAGAAEASEHLCYDIGDETAPGELAGKRQAEAHGGIQVRPGIVRHEHAAHHCKAPAEGYHHPAGALCLTSIESGGGADAVSHKHQYQSSEELEYAIMPHIFLTLIMNVLLHLPNRREGLPPGLRPAPDGRSGLSPIGP